MDQINDAHALSAARMWMRALYSVGITGNDIIDRPSLIEGQVAAEWRTLPLFLKWARRRPDLVNREARIHRKRNDARIGPENFKVIGKALGRPRRFGGIDFVWTKGFKLESPEGLEWLARANIAGASLRDSATLFRVGHNKVARIQKTKAFKTVRARVRDACEEQTEVSADDLLGD